jgi:hypothetical protein
MTINKGSSIYPLILNDAWYVKNTYFGILSRDPPNLKKNHDFASRKVDEPRPADLHRRQSSLLVICLASQLERRTRQRSFHLHRA